MKRFVVALVFACSSCLQPVEPADVDAGGPFDAGLAIDAGEAIDAGHDVDAGEAPDAGLGPDAGEAFDAGSPFDAGQPDGDPTRHTCTSTFGSGLSGAYFGRLDGTLVSLVPSSTSSCNGDSTHLHLQIDMNGAIYDVAVNLDGYETELDVAMPGDPWSEGWHPASLDYVALGLHDTAFTLHGIGTMRTHLESLLQTVNHISVFSTRYGPDGTHLVHRNDGGNDGALVLQPLSGAPHLIVFRFSNQRF